MPLSRRLPTTASRPTTTGAAVVAAGSFTLTWQVTAPTINAIAAVADLVLTGASFAASDYRLMLLGGAAIWLWASIVTAHLRNGLPATGPAPAPAR
jgi:hypothetical protein